MEKKPQKQTNEVKKQTNPENIEPDESLDCTGLYCPIPVFETRKKIDSIKTGEILEVKTDDPASEEDMKHWAKTTGNELLKIKKAEGNFIFYIKKLK